jgi:hypothetical protein
MMYLFYYVSGPFAQYLLLSPDGGGGGAAGKRLYLPVFTLLTLPARPAIIYEWTAMSRPAI